MSLAEQLSLFRRVLGPPAGESRPTQSVQHIALGNHILAYRLRRAARRRLTMTIDAHGLRVGAALGLPLAEIEGYIRQHAEWVLDKLAAQAARPAPPRIDIADGARLPLFGGECQVRVLPGHNRLRWIGDTLLLESRAGASLAALARRGLQQRALAHFTARRDHYAPLLEVAAPPLALSNAGTRWGSCSLQSGIRVHWRLIHLPAHLGDYVMVHELAHLHEMNHSRRYWRVVERAFPDWRSARDELRAAAAMLPVI